MLNAAPVTAVVATTQLDRAREFYEGKLGLQRAETPIPDDQGGGALYQSGDGSTLLVYERATAGDSEATCASFKVDDVEGTVQQLRDKGVTFEDYDMEGIKTEDGIASFGDQFKAAWFKDPDGNILCVANM